MDWFTLVDQVIAKERDSTEELEVSELSNDESCENFIKPDGELSALETAGLLSVMNTLMLQLYILHGRMTNRSMQERSTSAKRLYEIIERTQSELIESGRFDYLISTVEEESRKKRADLRVERINIEYERKIRDLLGEIRSNDRITTKEMTSKQEILASLKDEIQNLVANSESAIRYTDRWENAQQGENRMHCEREEMKLKGKLERLVSQYNNEIRVNDNICNFLSLRLKELENDLDSLKNEYDTNMKRRQEKINHLHNKAREQQFLLQELKESFNERQKEMKNYLKFKAEKKAEEERERFIHGSATKIQAWWRGTMVRRGLGPYRKRKKVGKEKKK